jgi:protein-S-isoprenylcysteine O-methyltransferase Ste14
LALEDEARAVGTNGCDDARDAETPRAYHRGLGFLRLLAIYALVALLLFLAEPTPRGVFVGFLAVALGEALRVWSAGHLWKTRELVTSGPYRYTRNPLYLGRLLIFSGLCLMAGLPHRLHWWVLAGGWLIFFLYYLPRKERVEPARLRAFHGEAYERYRRSVPALFPALRPYPHAQSRRWSGERMLRNREHWMLVGLLAATLVLLWKAYLGPSV